MRLLGFLLGFLLGLRPPRPVPFSYTVTDAPWEHWNSSAFTTGKDVTIVVKPPSYTTFYDRRP